jgi:cysteinyl-tRNA synthetase
MLKVTNTVTGKKELFESLVPNKVSMYVCGVTPYDRAHIGHGRCYVAFDLLYRVLRFIGYEVVYVRNFTDIDDKLLHRAEKDFGDKFRYLDIARVCIKSYHADMAALNCVDPDVEPHVTEHIPLIIAFIEELIASGHAYASQGDVYFDVRSFPAYGKLSKQNIDDLLVGARIDVNDKKRDPLDFALWKGEAQGEFWESPWGYGRPGWHIECSSLASRYLGQQIDIHGGGLDLVFPHHENEIAQSEGLYNKFFARYWVHNGLVNMGKEKMSKSLGNIFKLEDAFKQIDPMVLRFYFLSHHYRAPLEFSLESLHASYKGYQRLISAFGSAADSFDMDINTMRTMPIVHDMIEFLVDDLNTPGMFGLLFEHIRDLSNDETHAAAVKYILQKILGLTLVPLPEKVVEITPEIQKLFEEREHARMTKNWKRADEIRDQLVQLGIEVQDKKI